ncbi:hypothetical protein QA596_08630 [Balneolales bacterium ANBcel1]|nr:hypothetical protein [Balneolales bacterium ANBcel1]
MPLVFAPEVEAQRHAARSLIINPLLDDRTHLADGVSGAFHTFGGWAGFGVVAHSSDDHHLWYQDLGGYVELWRQGDSSSILLTGQIQFIADPHNDINFNPRAIFWEEGLLYTTRIAPGFLQLGFMHRCKHDIDNLDIGRERSLIFSSMILRYQHPVSLFHQNDLMMMAGFEHYVITWDRRTPRQLEQAGPNWNDLQNTATLHMHWHQNPEQTSPFAETRLQLINMEDRLRLNRSASVGWRFPRSGGEFRFVLSYEYLHDSGIPAEPESAHLLSLGIRAGSPFVFR